jgi:hypothetical protein
MSIGIKPSSNQQAEDVYRIIGNRPLDTVLSTFFIDFDFGTSSNQAVPKFSLIYFPAIDPAMLEQLEQCRNSNNNRKIFTMCVVIVRVLSVTSRSRLLSQFPAPLSHQQTPTFLHLVQGFELL